jgi:hypothetical protein
MLELVGRIKKSLGNKGNVTHELLRGPDSKFFISSIGIRDDSGYFQPNIELMSASLPESHLVSDRGSNHTEPGKNGYFILMKIDGGIPHYFQKVATVIPPDMKLHQGLIEMLQAAASDFSTWHLQDSRVDHTDFMIGMYKAEPDFRGQNYYVKLQIPVPDPRIINDRWRFARQAVEAAIGPGYVYHLTKDKEGTFIVYFSDRSDEHKPLIYLEQDFSSSSIVIQVTSNFHHPVKRSMNYRD